MILARPFGMPDIQASDTLVSSLNRDGLTPMVSLGPLPPMWMWKLNRRHEGDVIGRLARVEARRTTRALMRCSIELMTANRLYLQGKKTPLSVSTRFALTHRHPLYPLC